MSITEQDQTRALRPVEAVVMGRYGADLAGRVLELGSGHGRLTGYLAELSAETRGLEPDGDAVRYARAHYPDATFDHGDLRDLSPYADDSFHAVLAPATALDVLDDAERRRVLRETRRLLGSQGLLVLSSHNRAVTATIPRPGRLRRADLLGLTRDLVRLPRRLRNHWRLAALQEEHPGYAIVNDSARDYSRLSYYISRDEQEAQLVEAGFELVECLDLVGRAVPPGASAAPGADPPPELHYIARAGPGAARPR